MKKMIFASLLSIWAVLAAAQDETINGKLTVTEQASVQKLGLGTAASFNNFYGRKWWTAASENNYTEFAETNWGGASAMLFNCYSTDEFGGIDYPGNIKYATNAGPFNSGAGLIKFLGNGGVMSFRLSPESSGLGNSVDWRPVLDLTRDRAAMFYGSVRVAGNVGIGTTIPDQKLTVKGKIHAEEVIIDTNVPVVPDYVFKDGYALRPLPEVETYVKKNQHLPEVASATEMSEKGMAVGEMNLLLLKKIEELTLYIIDINKEVKTLKQQLNAGKGK